MQSAPSCGRAPRLLLAATALAAVALSGNPAQSQNLMVTARIGEACTAVGGTLNFGTYDPTAPDLVATGSITLDCTVLEDVLITLGDGLNANGNVTRAMKRAGSDDRLQYVLWQDQHNGTPWGGVSFGGPKTHTPTLGTNTIDVIGSIFTAQTLPSGDYADTVLITISAAP